MVKGDQNCWNIFFCRFYTHMNPFKLLFDFLELNLRFFLIWVIWGAFWTQKGPPKIVKGVQKFIYIFFRRFYTHIHPFKLLFDFLEQTLRFFLIWVIWGHFGPKKALKIVKGSKNFEIFFSAVFTLICTLLNCFLIFLEQNLRFFSNFFHFGGILDPKRP